MAVIGIDASRANSHDRTGTEWYIFNVLQQFKRIIPQHHKVILYLQSEPQPDLLPLPANWEIRILRWPPRLMWTQLRLSLAMIFPWRRPDILFIPAHTIPVIHPKQSIYVAHDLGFERMADLYGNHLIGGSIMNILIRLFTLGKYGTSELDYHRWSMRFAVRHAASIIAISQFTKSELQHFYQAPETLITVVHNGFSTEQYTEIANAEEPAVPFFLHVGRVELKKNIPYLIQAFAKFKQQTGLAHQLYLAGSPGFGYEQVIEQITNLGVSDSVKLLGYVATQDMNLLMNQATAFVFPTHYEGFGIPALEALSTGTRLVCSDIPALREVAGDAATYFNNTVVEELVAALVLVATEDGTEKSKYISNGKKQVAGFSWERCANETWQVLEKAIS